MAEDEVLPTPEPPRSDQATPNRGTPRTPATIEGTAEPLLPEVPPAADAAAETPAERAVDRTVHEPSMAAAAADLAAGVEPVSEAAAFGTAAPVTNGGGPESNPGDAAASAPARPVAPPARRSRWAGLLSLLGVLLVLLLGAILYTLLDPPNGDATAALRADTDALKQRLATLESRPVATVDLKPLQDRLGALGAATGQLKAELADTRTRLEALASAKSATEGTPTAPPVDLAPLQDKVAALDQSVTALQGVPKVDLAPTDAKVADLGQKLDTLQTALAALPHVDLAPITKAVADLDGRLKPLEAALSAPKAATQVTEARREGSAAETRAAPLAVTAQAAAQAIVAGKPFDTEVASLAALGVAEARLAPLRAVAAKGAATDAELLAGFDAVKGAVRRAGAPPVSGTVLDRMLAGAQTLVTVRPAGAVAGQDTDAVVSRIDGALRSGALPDALAQWAALPADGKVASQAWADRLESRTDAEAAARAVAADAIAAIAPPP